MRTGWPCRLALWLIALAAPLASHAAPAAAAPAPECGPGRATAAAVGRPSGSVAWRAALVARTPLWRSVPGRRAEPVGAVRPADASWLLVLDAARDREGRCWVRVRLPSRPNDAAGWVNAARVELEPTRWRIVVSRRARTVAVHRDGKPLRTYRVVVGASSTPTPGGLFSITDVWRSNPSDFLGSYIFALTAHSNVLQEFDGGDGQVALHGRGGASLLDPLGAARSHGCVRLSNRAIEWIVRTVGAGALPGIPVRVH